MMNSSDEKEALNALVGITEMVQEQGFTSMSKFFDDLFTALSTKLDKETDSFVIESSYTGIHLNQNYEESDFNLMIESFRNSKPIHAKYASQILTDTKKIFENFSNISECNLQNLQSDLKGVIVVGDLHGNFKDLYHIISKYDIPGKYYAFVFNGDFVDRGKQQSECLLTILYAFLLYPDRVFLNRGNHEDISINLDDRFRPNFREDTQSKFGKYGSTIFNRAQCLFKYLPLGTIVKNKNGNSWFIVHGGISERVDLNNVAKSKYDRSKFSTIINRKCFSLNGIKLLHQISDMLWSDPFLKYGCEKNSHRGVGYFFGPDVSESFCKKNGFSAIIRSHEVKTEGVHRDHPFCYTVFSSSNYCAGNNKAGVILIQPNDSNLIADTFYTYGLTPDEFDVSKRLLVKSFKKYLDKEANQLISIFEQFDHLKIGLLNINIWSKILSDYLYQKNQVKIDPKHFITLKDYLCPCNEQDSTAQYKHMFGSIRSSQTNEIVDLINVLFNLIDTDGNGKISNSEAKNAINVMNSVLGTNYDSSFLNEMDFNKDGKIDKMEFSVSFIKAYNL